MFLTLLVAFFAGSLSYADCTVTTDCNTYNFPNESSVSVSTRSTSNGVFITIRGANGNVLATETCATGRVSSSCSSGGGSGDICDFLPSWLAAIYGC